LAGQLVECVPNISEGRDLVKVQAIAESIAGVPGVLLLGYESDPDHNRSVITFAGPPEAVREGAIRCAREAAARIDLRHHEGVHPRLGACDVIPFVPLCNATLDDCVELARQTAAALWKQARIPSYFYEHAAQPSRKPLEKVRRKGFEQRLTELDAFPPDTGGPGLHPTAGASCIGARGFLIAYNVELATADLEIARSVARSVRASSGGFSFVKAMGVKLRSRDQAQVSMNLIRFEAIPLEELYARIEEEAARLGTCVADSELVGFIPRKAYQQAPLFFERCRNFSTGRVIEERLRELGLPEPCLEIKRADRQ
jgi:glutamate formiminotransferase